MATDVKSHNLKTFEALIIRYEINYYGKLIIMENLITEINENLNYLSQSK